MRREAGLGAPSAKGTLQENALIRCLESVQYSIGSLPVCLLYSIKKVIGTFHFPYDLLFHLFSCCCCSAAKPYLTLCDPMDCSTPVFPCFFLEGIYSKRVLARWNSFSLWAWPEWSRVLPQPPWLPSFGQNATSGQASHFSQPYSVSLSDCRVLRRVGLPSPFPSQNGRIWRNGFSFHSSERESFSWFRLHPLPFPVVLDKVTCEMTLWFPHLEDRWGHCYHCGVLGGDSGPLSVHKKNANNLKMQLKKFRLGLRKQFPAIELWDLPTAH